MKRVHRAGLLMVVLSLLWATILGIGWTIAGVEPPCLMMQGCRGWSREDVALAWVMVEVGDDI